MPVAVNGMVYDTWISLNRVFVFEFVNWVPFGARRKDPAQKGVCRIFGFWRNRRVPKTNHNKSTTTTNEGWTCAALLMEWIEKVFVKDTQPLHNEYHSVALCLDEPQAYVYLQIITKRRTLGVHIVPQFTEVVQPLDGVVLRPVKLAFTKLEEKH